MSDTQTFLFNTSFETRVERSKRVLEVAEAFGIGLNDTKFVVFDNLELTIRRGDIIYITGQSGSGKSLLLRGLAAECAKRGARVANIDAVELLDKPLIDQIGIDTQDAIKYLSLAGLNDAFLFVRKPEELSDGQRYRFKLAKVIESRADIWVADEFMAVLDRTSAKVIAFNLQKIARKTGTTVIVATTHTDLKEDLHPSLYIEKKYRERIHIEANK